MAVLLVLQVLFSQILSWYADDFAFPKGGGASFQRASFLGAVYGPQWGPTCSRESLLVPGSRYVTCHCSLQNPWKPIMEPQNSGVRVVKVGWLRPRAPSMQVRLPLPLPQLLGGNSKYFGPGDLFFVDIPNMSCCDSICQHGPVPFWDGGGILEFGGLLCMLYIL